MARKRFAVGAPISGAALLWLAACTTPKQAQPPLTPIADPAPTESGTTPGEATGNIDRGMAYLQHNAFADALPYLEKAAAEKPNSAEANYYLALACDKTGQRDRAEAGYQRAILLDVKLVAARINLGALYLEDPAQPDKAIAALEPAVALEPDAVDLHLNLALAYRLSKQPDKAIEHYRAALKSQDSVEVRQMLADVLLDAKKWPELIAELHKLAPAFAKDPKRLGAIGARFGKAGDYHACVETLNKAILVDGKDASLYVSRGVCRHELHELETNVVVDYAKATEVDPKYQPAWYYLGMSELGLRKRAKAADAFGKCAAIDPNTPIGQRAQEKVDAMVRESGGTPVKHKR